MTAVCDALDVSRAGYYAWLSELETARAKRDRELMPVIRNIFWKHRRRYGARRIAVEMQAGGQPCGVDRVAKLLKIQGLVAIQPKSFKPKTTDSRHGLGYSPNLLQRASSPEAINRVWVADITYIPLKEKAFAYLALVLDVCSRRVVGWSLAEHMNESLIHDALQHAIRDRQPPPGLIHHSDRGRSVCRTELPSDPPPRRHPPKHEPRGQLLRQRHHGILLRDHQDRTGNDRIPRQPAGPPRSRQLSRLLQPRTPAFIPRPTRPSSFRGPTTHLK